MKVLIINDFSKKLGGAETFVHTIKENLEKKDHLVEILGSEKGENFHSFFSRWSSKFWYNKTKEKIKKFNPDVIHVNNCVRVISPSVIQAASDSKIPIVMTFHDYHYFCPRIWAVDKEGRPCKCWKGFFSGIFSKCRGFRESPIYFPAHILKVIRVLLHRRVLNKNKILFVSPSKALAKDMEKILKKDVRVIPNGVLIPEKKTNYAKEIIFVGRLSKENGIQTIMKTLDGVKDYEVLIFNVGDLEKELKSKYKNVGFLGKVDLKKTYEKASIALSPSLWKTNAPFAISEAMSYGICVIASKNGGAAEMINHNDTGLLFETGNEKDFREKLDYLLKNPGEIKRMGRNAREFAKKNYDWKKIIKEYEKTYHEAIKNN